MSAAYKVQGGQTRERVFAYLRNQLLAGHTPSVREIQQALGFRAVQTVQAHLDALVTEGRLHRRPGKARSYRLPQTLDRPPQVLVPLLGKVQAGALQAAIEDPEGYVCIEARGPIDALFALRVRGESMIGAGIFDGDIVIVRRQPAADNGDIVVALVGDEATVKRLRTRRGRLVLEPANPTFEPITVQPDRLVLLGKVIELRRDLEGAVRKPT